MLVHKFFEPTVFIGGLVLVLLITIIRILRLDFPNIHTFFQVYVFYVMDFQLVLLSHLRYSGPHITIEIARDEKGALEVARKLRSLRLLEIEEIPFCCHLFWKKE